MALLFNDNERFVYPYNRFNELAGLFLKFFYQHYTNCKEIEVECSEKSYDVEPVFLGKGFYYSIIVTDNNTSKRLDTETCLFVTNLYFHDILLIAGKRDMTFGGLGDDAEFVNAITGLITALDEIVFTYFSHNTSLIEKWKNFDVWAFYHRKKLFFTSWKLHRWKMIVELHSDREFQKRLIKDQYKHSEELLKRYNYIFEKI